MQYAEGRASSRGGGAGRHGRLQPGLGSRCAADARGGRATPGLGGARRRRVTGPRRRPLPPRAAAVGGPSPTTRRPPGRRGGQRGRRPPRPRRRAGARAARAPGASSWTTGCRPARRRCRRAPQTQCAGLGLAGGPRRRGGRRRRPRGVGARLRVRAPRRRRRRAPVGPARPHPATTRPRRCCSAWPAARAPGPSPGWRRRAAASAARCSGCRATLVRAGVRGGGADAVGRPAQHRPGVRPRAGARRRRCPCSRSELGRASRTRSPAPRPCCARTPTPSTPSRCATDDVAALLACRGRSRSRALKRSGRAAVRRARDQRPGHGAARAGRGLARPGPGGAARGVRARGPARLASGRRDRAADAAPGHPTDGRPRSTDVPPTSSGSWSPRSRSATRSPSWPKRSTRTTRPGAAARRGAQGRGHGDGRPRARARTPVSMEFMAVSSYGSGDDVPRRGPDPQGPRPRHRRSARPGRRGHHRLRAHAVLAAAQPAQPRPGVASRCARCCASPRPPRSTCRCGTSASTSRRSSSSATAWTTPSATATCRSSACSAPRPTATTPPGARLTGPAPVAEHRPRPHRSRRGRHRGVPSHSHFARRDGAPAPRR